MYWVIEYYELDGHVKEHPVTFKDTFEEAYLEMLEVYKNLDGCVVTILGLSKENIDYIVLNKFEKDKVLLTVVKK